MLTGMPISHPDPAGLAGHIPSLLTMIPPFVTAQTCDLPTLTCLKPVVCVPDSEIQHYSFKICLILRSMRKIYLIWLDLLEYSANEFPLVTFQ